MKIRKIVGGLSFLVFGALVGCGAADNTASEEAQVVETQALQAPAEPDQSVQPLACQAWGTTCAPVANCCPGTTCKLTGSGVKQCCHSLGPGGSCN